ncbi:hypothetical protein Sarmat_00480 [Rickettsiales endosymbiont of Paramecium tredecaurelia]|uniref:hypothetical protein n=1 Tax=Candidatus Sarmatiella mevalonica TaxID=2770581 RepID=UPI0019243F1E|nr:hypothetical protein [Candidatus Sarmatiella mevalonica]MBL3284630.1 hypothetical protein [Candidatus Sarmatiella mevalonica]
MSNMVKMAVQNAKRNSEIFQRSEQEQIKRHETEKRELERVESGAKGIHTITGAVGSDQEKCWNALQALALAKKPESELALLNSKKELYRRDGVTVAPAKGVGIDSIQPFTISAISASKDAVFDFAGHVFGTYDCCMSIDGKQFHAEGTLQQIAEAFKQDRRFIDLGASVACTVDANDGSKVALKIISAEKGIQVSCTRIGISDQKQRDAFARAQGLRELSDELSEIMDIYGGGISRFLSNPKSKIDGEALDGEMGELFAKWLAVDNGSDASAALRNFANFYKIEGVRKRKEAALEKEMRLLQQFLRENAAFFTQSHETFLAEDGGMQKMRDFIDSLEGLDADVVREYESVLEELADAAAARQDAADRLEALEGDRKLMAQEALQILDANGPNELDELDRRLDGLDGLDERLDELAMLALQWQDKLGSMNADAVAVARALHKAQAVDSERMWKGAQKKVLEFFRDNLSECTDLVNASQAAHKEPVTFCALEYFKQMKDASAGLSDATEIQEAEDAVKFPLLSTTPLGTLAVTLKSVFQQMQQYIERKTYSFFVADEKNVYDTYESAKGQVTVNVDGEEKILPIGANGVVEVSGVEITVARGFRDFGPIEVTPQSSMAELDPILDDVSKYTNDFYNRLTSAISDLNENIKKLRDDDEQMLAGENRPKYTHSKTTFEMGQLRAKYSEMQKKLEDQMRALCLRPNSPFAYHNGTLRLTKSNDAKALSTFIASLQSSRVVAEVEVSSLPGVRVSVGEELKRHLRYNRGEVFACKKEDKFEVYLAGANGKPKVSLGIITKNGFASAIKDMFDIKNCDYSAVQKLLSDGKSEMRIFNIAVRDSVPMGKSDKIPFAVDLRSIHARAKSLDEILRRKRGVMLAKHERAAREMRKRRYKIEQINSRILMQASAMQSLTGDS